MPATVCMQYRVGAAACCCRYRGARRRSSALRAPTSWSGGRTPARRAWIGTRRRSGGGFERREERAAARFGHRWASRASIWVPRARREEGDRARAWRRDRWLRAKWRWGSGEEGLGVRVSENGGVGCPYIVGGGDRGLFGALRSRSDGSEMCNN